MFWVCGSQFDDPLINDRRTLSVFSGFTMHCVCLWFTGFSLSHAFIFILFLSLLDHGFVFFVSMFICESMFVQVFCCVFSLVKSLLASYVERCLVCLVLF